MSNKDKIRKLLENALPLVDFDSEFLFSELDSLGVTTILMVLADEFNIQMEATDATPRNLKSIDSIVELVELKIAANGEPTVAAYGERQRQKKLSEKHD